MWMTRWLTEYWRSLRREACVPRPPWRASKRVATILNGVWYGHLTPDQARKKAADWGWSSEEVEDLILRATQPPSYWSSEQDANPVEPHLADPLLKASLNQGQSKLN